MHSALLVSPRVIALWLVAGACLLSYPAVMSGFMRALPPLVGDAGLLGWLWAGLLTLGVFLPSLLGLGLLCDNQLQPPARVRERALLHVLACTPVFYVLMVVLSYYLGISLPTKVIWLTGLAAMMGGIVLLQPSPSGPLHPAWFRVFHGVLALLFIVGFFFLHWINHLTALWSTDTHGTVLEALRLWYRSAWLEPVLFTLCLLLILSGFYMAVGYLRRGGDKWRRLQTVSGSYLGFFLCTHLAAVLFARGAGTDTNWHFATGEQGLVLGFQFLIPYYTLALVFFSLHAALAIRQILQAHRVSSGWVRWGYSFARGTGLVLTALVMAAALGFSIKA